MTRMSGFFGALLVSALVFSGGARAADPSAANEKDPLRATLIESKERNRGVTIHTHGTSISLLVTAIDDKYVIGRSQQASRIVVRIDHIDGVSAAF